MKFLELLGTKKQGWTKLKTLLLNGAEVQFNFYKNAGIFSDHLV